MNLLGVCQLYIITSKFDIILSHTGGCRYFMKCFDFNKVYEWILVIIIGRVMNA